MSFLPVQGRCAFASLHPAVTFLFFAGAIVLCMVFANPICQIMAAGCAAMGYLSFRGRAAWGFIGVLAAAVVVIALVSPLFNTQGATVLFSWWGGRPYTLETLALGASTGLMLMAMMLWFASYHLVMTFDKFTYLFGRAIPALSMVLTMVLRLVPRYRRRMEALSCARSCIGKGVGNGGSALDRVKDAGDLLSAFSGDTLEGAVVTADSMGARGFGLAGRTHFGLFPWERRDTVLLVLTSVLLGASVVGLAVGGTTVAYFPTLTLPPIRPLGVAGALCYFAFMMLPTAFNLGERVLWRCSLSNI